MEESCVSSKSRSSPNHAYREEQLSWMSGSALMRTQGARSSCLRKFLRKDLAVD